MVNRENPLLEYRKLEMEVRGRAKQVKLEYTARVPQAKWLRLDLDGAVDFLNWANQQGKNLHVISNSPAFVIETYIKQIEADGYRAGFTHVISARDIERESRKPHPASFQQLLDSFQPQEDIMQALYIGNEQGDVLFATNATNQLNGIHVVPVLITRGLDYSHIKMPPHCQFPTFMDLKEFLNV